MWKSKWYDYNDEYYGYGNKINAYHNIGDRINVDYLTRGWNNQDNIGLGYESPKLVNWQLLVAPGLM